MFPSNDRPSARTVWLTVALFALLTRLATLGLQQPWLDEINNWLTAHETGLTTRLSAHFLTYQLQYLGLAVSDTVWGLRAYAALFGIAAMVAAVRWVQLRRGNGPAFAAALLIGLSPFVIFYSQDANHYAPLLLTGILAALSVDWFLEGERPQPLLFLLAGALCAAGALFHPAGILPFVCFMLMLFLWMMANADRFPPEKIPLRTKRLLPLLLGTLLLAYAILFTPLMDWVEARAGYAPDEPRPVGLTWTFFSALLADFFAAPFHHQALGIVIGILGGALAVAGWIRCWRSGRRWAALGAGVLALCLYVPFYLIPLGHFFYPKFFAPIVPILLIGVALAVPFETAERRGQRLTQSLAIACLLFFVLFAGRSLWWQAKRLVHHHQPTTEVTRYLAGHTPEEAIIVTRNHFSSRAFGFLWQRAGEPRRHFATTSHELIGLPAIQQIDELFAAGHNHVYFLSLIETRDRYSPDFDEFLDQRTEIAHHFPSLSPDDFVPLERSIALRRVLPPEAPPLALPRHGARASSLTEEDRILSTSRQLGAGFLLEPGMAASWKFELDAQTTAINIAGEWNGNGPRPGYLVFHLEGPREGTWLITADGLPDETRIRLPAALQPGLYRLHLIIANNNGRRSNSASRFAPHQIAIADQNEEAITAEKLEPIIQNDGEPLRADFTGIRRRNLDTASVLQREVTIPESEHPWELLVPVITISVGGLENIAVRPEFHRSLHTRISMSQPISRTMEWNAAAAVLPGEDTAGMSKVILFAQPRHQRGVRQPEVTLGPLKLYGRRTAASDTP